MKNGLITYLKDIGRYFRMHYAMLGMEVSYHWRPIWVPFRVHYQMEKETAVLRVGSRRKKRLRNQYRLEYISRVIDTRCDYDTWEDYVFHLLTNRLKSISSSMSNPL